MQAGWLCLRGKGRGFEPLFVGKNIEIIARILKKMQKSINYHLSCIISITHEKQAAVLG